MIEYTQYTELPKSYITRKLSEFFEEDAPAGDMTTNGTINKNEISTGEISAEEELIFAGEGVIRIAFENASELEILKPDGSIVRRGEPIARFRDYSVSILTKERVVLNLIQRLSGIATLTSKFVEAASPFGVKILDTRKTTPGLRLFEKYAVAVGGGSNHRLDLSSGILIKDNHIAAAGGIKNAVNRMKALNDNLPVEVEVESFAQIDEAIEAGAEGLLLDNMNPETTIKAVQKIRKYPNGEKIYIESSGGINLGNISAYVGTGINAISIGALTHSAKSANIHLEFI